MFGVWRVLLAIEVVVYHLVGVPVIGEYAVFAFFVLSGFLMTAIMHDTYGYTPGGFAAYLQNRALRLYPNYWFAVMISVLVIAVAGPSAVAAYNPHIVVPPTPAAWVENLTMVFFGWFPKDHLARLVPPAWALTVEILYYVLIGFGISRTRQSTIAWVFASVGYVVIALVLGGGGEKLYSAVLAGSLPFAMGALTWHYRDDWFQALLTVRLANPVTLIALRWLSYAAFTSGNMITGLGWLVSLGNYVNIGLSVLIVCTLFRAAASRRSRQIDRAIGNFSYPIYLLHWQGAAIASLLIFGSLTTGRSVEGLIVAASGLLVTMALGLVCVQLIDPTVERRRRRLRAEAIAS